MTQRARNYRLKISKHRKLVVSARPYRTIRSYRRTGRHRQFALPVYLLLRPTKEIAFFIEKKKSVPAGRIDRAWYRIIRQPALPFVLIIVGFSGIIYFSAQGKEQDTIEPRRSFSVPTAESNTQKANKAGLTRSVPTHVRVKKVGIDAPIMQVGQNKDKTIEVPPLNKNITGWYNKSPTPGEVGLSIIVGHVDTIDGPSVFYRLKDLNAGDIIEVTRKDKKVVKFKVVALEQFSQDKFPTKKVYGNLDYSGLRLITCGGTFNQQTQRYTANTVVFAKMVEEKKPA